MKKDIDFSPVKNVHVAICKTTDGWRAYLLNRSDEMIENVMITSRGYGEFKSEKQKTSVLRHVIPHVEPKEFALIETVDKSVFHLNNEYWVSYYINRQVFDKKFIFLPDSIVDKNLTTIAELDLQGILHD